MGVPDIMQEAGNATTSEWPEFKTRKRFMGRFELLVIFLLATGTILGGYIDLLVFLPLFLTWVLVKRRSRHEISLPVGQVACNRPDLMRDLTADEFLLGEYTVPGFYRFRSGKATLWVWAPFYLNSLADLAEKAFTKDAMSVALGKVGVSGMYRIRGLWLGYLFLLVIYTYWGIPLYRTFLFVSENRPLANPPIFLLAIAGGAVIFAFLLGLSYRWHVTETTLELRNPYGLYTIPFENIVAVNLDALAPMLHVYYADGDETKRVRLLQLGLNRSLLPLYFFLRSRVSNLPSANGTVPLPQS
jgi:hypothetical protein